MQTERNSKEKENLENNTAYIQLCWLPSKQTKSIGKTLELSHELLNECKMWKTMKCSIHCVSWNKFKDLTCLCLKTKGLRRRMYRRFLLLKQVYSMNSQFSFSQGVAPSP